METFTAGPRIKVPGADGSSISQKFRTTVVAGTFFRLGTGAMPFLFPLMLQLSFGLTPFQSGSITFATAVGAFAAKFVSEPILRTVGFRMSLVIATFITVLGVLAMGFYGPQTSLGVMLPLLVGR